MKRFAAAALIAGLGAGTASAELINITSEKYTGGNTVTLSTGDLQGPGALGDGTTWNVYDDNNSTDATTSGVRDSDGNLLTGVTFSTTAGESRGNSDGVNSWDLEVLRTYWQNFGKGQDQTVTVGGLTPGAIYDVWITSYAPGTTSFNNNSQAWLTEGGAGTWSTANTTSSASSQSIDNGTAPKNSSTWVDGYNYVTFASVVVDGSGNITFLGDADDIGDGETYSGAPDTVNHRLQLNSIQLQLVPEPSSLALLGLGGLCVIRRRRG